jgi:hypothetical protein
MNSPEPVFIKCIPPDKYFSIIGAQVTPHAEQIRTDKKMWVFPT